MYLALPAGDDPMIVHNASPPGSSILELGSGPGRLTRVLIALGHEVVAVDDSQEMLAHVTGAETVCADLFDIDLGRRFDVVLAASHLINHPDEHMRGSLLAVCKRHLSPEGIVLVQRYAPGWPPQDGERTGSAGPVDMTFRVRSRRGAVVSASVTYQLGTVQWIQDYEAVDVDDDLLTAAVESAGLRVEGSIDDTATWVKLGHQ